MNDIKEFQKSASIELATTRKEITDSCGHELEEYRELYNKLHKSFKTKRLIYLFLATVSFLAVSIFLSVSCFADCPFIISYDLTLSPYVFFFVGGSILLWSIISSEDKIYDQVYGNKIMEEIRSSIKEKIKKIIKNEISAKTRKGLIEIAQMIGKSITFFDQGVGENVDTPSLNFYYYFDSLRYGGVIKLYFDSSFSFKGKTWHGLPSHSLITFDESLNYTLETWDRVF